MKSYVLIVALMMLRYQIFSSPFAVSLSDLVLLLALVMFSLAKFNLQEFLKVTGACFTATKFKTTENKFIVYPNIFTAEMYQAESLSNSQDLQLSQMMSPKSNLESPVREDHSVCLTEKCD